MAGADLTLAGFVDLNEARMAQRSRRSPARKLQLRERWHRGHQFQCKLGTLELRGLREKNDAVIRSAQMAKQGKHAIDRMPFQLRPYVAHRVVCFPSSGATKARFTATLYSASATP